jgi:hypothetical protein
MCYVINMLILNKSRLDAVVRSMMFRVNCGYYLVRIVAVNFIVLLHPFCSFFLFKEIVPYLCICVLLHSGIHLATGPALLSLRVNTLSGMERYCQYKWKQFFCLNKFSLTTSLFLLFCRYDLSLLYVCLFAFSCSNAVSVIGLMACVPAHKEQIIE